MKTPLLAGLVLLAAAPSAAACLLGELNGHS